MLASLGILLPAVTARSNEARRLSTFPTVIFIGDTVTRETEEWNRGTGPCVAKRGSSGNVGVRDLSPTYNKGEY
jgi:hypothetical protein